MNVLLLTQFFSTSRGGGEYMFNLIAKKLSQDGHKVWIITSKINGMDYLDYKNVELVFVPPTLEYKGGLPPTFLDNVRYLFNAIIKGQKIIKDKKIDIIHSNNFSPALAGGFLSSLTSKPHITSIWDIFSLCGEDYWKRWGKQNNVSKIHGKIGAMIEKLIIKIPCKAIHTISQATYDDLAKFGAKKKIHVISPSIEKIDCVKNQVNPFCFIVIGRLVFYKNIKVLVKAINIVKKTEPQIKLLIVGGGPEEEEIKNLIFENKLESNIELLGYVTTEEKFRLLSQSNAFLFPSLCEGFGLVILEAFSQNKPVLVSNVRPMSDIISNNETGYVIEPHNEEQWAEKILELIKNIEISKQMGEKGRAVLERNYDVNKMYEKIIEMYENYV